jgi:hypothetical protein
MLHVDNLLILFAVYCTKWRSSAQRFESGTLSIRSRDSLNSGQFQLLAWRSYENVAVFWRRRITYPVRLLARSRANFARRLRQQITSRASRGKPRMQETMGITMDSGDTATESNTTTFTLKNLHRNITNHKEPGARNLFPSSVETLGRHVLRWIR